MEADTIVPPTADSADAADAAPPSPRTRVRRHPERGVYDRAAIEAILDEAAICHVGFVHDGAPVVIPTIHARIGDALYLHGSAASRMMRTLAAGAEVCVTATILDGLVLARSVANHSMNYRSVVVLGRARPVEGREEKLAALRAVVEHVDPGRWGVARHPNEQELHETLVAAVSLGEASAKVRTGPPKDDPDDLALPVWAGVVPLRMARGEPVPDEPRGQGPGGP